MENCSGLRSRLHLVNNSRALGITDYQGKEHLVIGIDYEATREGELCDVGSTVLPAAIHTVGYILIDTETGVHSLGNIKSRVGIFNLDHELTTYLNNIKFSAGFDDRKY